MACCSTTAISTLPTASRKVFSPASPVFNSAKDSPDFIRLLADRAYKHLFNGGAMSNTAMQARYTAITGTIQDAVIGESARWGDTLEPAGDPTRLANGGERLRLESALGETIADLTYGDSDPWPGEADGISRSQVFIDSVSSTVAGSEQRRAAASTPGIGRLFMRLRLVLQ